MRKKYILLTIKYLGLFVKFWGAKESMHFEEGHAT